MSEPTPDYAKAAPLLLQAAGLVGDGCPWESVQQMVEDLRTAAHAVKYGFDDVSYDRANDRRVESALLDAAVVLDQEEQA
jgi:hypothetical protein